MRISPWPRADSPGAGSSIDIELSREMRCSNSEMRSQLSSPCQLNSPADGDGTLPGDCDAQLSPWRRSPSDLERLSPVSQLLLTSRPGQLHRHFAILRHAAADEGGSSSAHHTSQIGSEFMGADEPVTGGCGSEDVPVGRACSGLSSPGDASPMLGGSRDHQSMSPRPPPVLVPVRTLLPNESRGLTLTPLPRYRTAVRASRAEPTPSGLGSGQAHPWHRYAGAACEPGGVTSPGAASSCGSPCCSFRRATSDPINTTNGLSAGIGGSLGGRVLPHMRPVLADCRRSYTHSAAARAATPSLMHMGLAPSESPRADALESRRATTGNATVELHWDGPDLLAPPNGD